MIISYLFFLDLFPDNSGIFVGIDYLKFVLEHFNIFVRIGMPFLDYVHSLCYAIVERKHLFELFYQFAY